MKAVGGKREIEAVCDIWENGIVGYLYHKISRVHTIEGEMDGINVMELEDINIDVMRADETRIQVEDALDEHCIEFIDEWDDDILLMNGHECICDIHLDGSHGDDSEIGSDSMQDDDLLNI